MIDAGILLGIPRAVAADLLVQTALGRRVMLRDAGEHPVKLREAVTSPGAPPSTRSASWRSTASGPAGRIEARDVRDRPPYSKRCANALPRGRWARTAGL
jgi:hypothetical protein